MVKGQARLAQGLEIYELDAQNWWRIRVDALSGEVRDKTNYVVHENPMQIYSESVESPSHGNRSIINVASLAQWIDGQCTRGNNVYA